MNIALIGSVSSSETALDALHSGGVKIRAVLGLDDSQAAAVCDYRSLREPANRTGIPYHAFVKITDESVERFLRQHRPDLLWVIGLSQLVPAGLIDVARHGGVGFHPTMLPRGRGRAPVAWTILLGEPAAVNLFFLVDEPDAGDIIVQREVPVLPDDYSEDLIARTNEGLHEVILELAPRIKEGNLPRTPQDHAQATYYEKRTPADGLLDWSQPTDGIYRLIRAAGRPYHGAFAILGDDRVVIWRARPAQPEQISAEDRAATPGTVLQVDARLGVQVRTVDSALWLTDTIIDGGGAEGARRALEVGRRLRGKGQ